MQQFRSNLTRLKGLVEQKLPNGGDIYGYPGISKTLLISAIDNAYNISLAIKEDDESRFEVVCLKRVGSALSKTLKDFLETDTEEPEKRSRFNGFVDALSALIEKTKMTYYIVAKHGVRNDEELAQIRATIADFAAINDELKEAKNDVESKIDSVSTAINGITTQHKIAEQNASEVKVWHGNTNRLYSEIAHIHEAIAGWDKEIQKCGTRYQAQNKLINELAAAGTQSRDKLSADALTGSKHVEELAKAADEHLRLLEEIRQTLAGANRVGMASSFEARKTELGRQQVIWQVIFVMTVGLITLAVWKLVLPTIVAGTPEWSKLLPELGIVSPLIWLGWFAAKQYGYTSKLREDYAFKSAAAMAYEGHKKAAREVNEDLERILLEFSLYNMAQNPIRLYESGSIHGTPMHEVLDQLLKKLPMLKRVSAEVPSLGKFDVAGKDSTPVKEK